MSATAAKEIFTRARPGQTDVLAGFALGTAAGYYAHRRKSPFFLELLPHGFEAGLKRHR